MFKMMTAVALMALLASTNAFSPTLRSSVNAQAAAPTATSDLPYFIKLTETNTRQEEGIRLDPIPTTTVAAAVERTPAPNKNATPSTSHKDGIFSPVVLAAKAVIGDEQMNKARAKVISLHSDVIANFVSTAQWRTGQAALKTLFQVADKNANGLLEEDELKLALQTLGFDWLKEKQVKGIFKRADTDENGAIDLEEFMAEAPKTLKTNLTKLAKKNGGELGFLV